MDAKEKIVGGVALGRRRQRRQSGLANVLRLARAQQADRREEGGRLIGGNGEPVAPEQRDEGEERPQRLRRDVRLAHAAASARIEFEPAGDVSEIFLVLERHPDRTLERFRPAGAALVEQSRGLRPVHGLGDAGRLAQAARASGGPRPPPRPARWTRRRWKRASSRCAPRAPDSDSRSSDRRSAGAAPRAGRACGWR